MTEPAAGSSDERTMAEAKAIARLLGARVGHQSLAVGLDAIGRCTSRITKVRLVFGEDRDGHALGVTWPLWQALVALAEREEPLAVPPPLPAPTPPPDEVIAGHLHEALVALGKVSAAIQKARRKLG